jgi:ankyrin repeat protein
VYLFLVQSGLHQTVDTLLSTHQLNVDYSDIDGFTALEIAVDRGDVEMVKVLIKHGASVRNERLGYMSSLALARGEEGKEIANLVLLEAKRRKNENV